MKIVRIFILLYVRRYRKNAVKEIVIPNSVTHIGANVFSQVKYIEYHGKAKGAPWRAKSMN